MTMLLVLSATPRLPLLVEFPWNFCTAPTHLLRLLRVIAWIIRMAPSMLLALLRLFTWKTLMPRTYLFLCFLLGLALLARASWHDRLAELSIFLSVSGQLHLMGSADRFVPGAPRPISVTLPRQTQLIPVHMLGHARSGTSGAHLLPAMRAPLLTTLGHPIPPWRLRRRWRWQTRSGRW